MSEGAFADRQQAVDFIRLELGRRVGNSRCAELMMNV